MAINAYVQIVFDNSDHRIPVCSELTYSSRKAQRYGRLSERKWSFDAPLA